MKTWCTEVKAKSPVDGSMKTYFGPNIEAETLEARVLRKQLIRLLLGNRTVNL